MKGTTCDIEYLRQSLIRQRKQIARHNVMKRQSIESDSIGLCSVVTESLQCRSRVVDISLVC